MKSFKAGYFLRIVFFLLCISTAVSAQKEASSESDLKKQADRYFDSDDFEDALVPYSQLLSLYPQNAVYNYRYGLCLIVAGKEKSNAANYLQKASLDPATPEEVWYYLGKAYMVLGRFSDAQTALQKFNQVASVSKQRKLESDILMANCVNAIAIQKNKKNVVILDSRNLSLNEFSHFYDWSLANGRYVPAADQFLTSQDKDKEENPVMFISNDKQTIYLASYGKNSSGGKDIYVVRKMPNGQWSQPENLGAPINTSANEDFPYLDRDGRTLYFCSKGDKSIGGYDIFKSTFDFNSGKWSEPENLGWPINTIGDDYLYVPINKGHEAFYATTIESDKKSISIRKIQLPDQITNQVTISGLYFPQDQRVRRDARISVLQGNGQGLVTSVYTDPQTGKYEVDLEPGKDYVIVVEGGGYLPHAETFSIPSGLNNPDLRQVVKLNRGKENESMILENYFYPVDLASTQTPSNIISANFDATADTSSLMVVKIDNKEILVTKPGTGHSNDALAGNDDDSTNSNIIRIEKDEYDPTLEKNMSADDIRQKDEESKRAQELAEDEKAPKYDITISNEELASIAANDARTARTEADSLKREVARLNSAADEHENLANSYANKATKADDTDKVIYQNKALELRTESENLRRQSTDLQIAASAKENEALSSEQDAKALLETIDTQPLASAKKGGKKATKSSGSETVTQLQEPNQSEAITDTKSDAHANESAESSSEKSNSTTTLGEKGNVSENKPNPKPNSADSKTSTVGEDQANKNQSKQNADDNVVSDQLADNTTLKENSSGNSDVSSPATKGEVDKSQSDDQNTTAIKETKPDGKTDKKNGNKETTSNTAQSQNESDEALSKSGEAKQSDGAIGQKDNSTTENSVNSNNADSNSTESLTENSTPSVDSKTSNSTTPISHTSNQGSANTSSVGDKETSAQKSQGETAEPSTASGNQKPSANNQTQNTSSTGTSDTKIEGRVNNSSSPDVKINESVSLTSGDEANATNPNQPKENQNVVNAGGKQNSSEQSKTTLPENQTGKNGKASAVKPSVNNSEVNSASKSTEEQTTNSKTGSDSNTSPANQTVENTEVLQENAKDTPAGSQEIALNSNSPDSVYQSKAELKQYELPPATEDRSPMPSDINARKSLPVKEEARLAYQEYKRKYSTSQRLAEQSVDMQKRIAVTKASPERDSLIDVSNSLSEQSADMWKESIAQLNAAKQIDPEVKEKMELNEQIVAYNSSLPTNSSTNRANAGDDAIAKAQTQQAVTIPSEPTSENTAKQNTEAPTNTITQAETTPDANAPQEKDETIAMVNTPVVVNNEPMTPPFSEEEAKQVEEVTNFAVETPNGTEKIKISTEGIDTRHPDFPTYVELNKQITYKQVETINVFAEAVNLNKKAVEEKKEQGRLMDYAETQTDIQKKAKVFVQADSMKALSETDMKAASEKFKIAQGKTGDVKQVTAQMEEVKSRIAIPGAKTATQSTVSIVHPEQQQTEVASTYIEAQKQEPIALKETPTASNTNANTNTKSTSSQQDQETPAANPQESLSQSAPSVSPIAGSVTASVTPEEKETFSKNSFSIADKPVYSEQNPIPMNPQLPEGLVFKVQIGAFHNQIPAEKFNGVQPITGETTRPGWIRYCVGLFQTFEPANVVKKEMQRRGFKDAFVVAYFNGKRIELNEAYAMLTKGGDKLGKDYVATSRKEMALLRANDIRPENIASVRKGEVGEDEKSFYGNDAAKEMNSIAAVEYAVQVGVYRSANAPRVLSPLMPLLTEQIRTNLYRFTTDHYSDYATADSMKRFARRTGVKDAFIVVYRNGAMATLASVPPAERRNSTTANAVTNSSVSTSGTNTTTNTTSSNPIESSQTSVTAGLVFRVQLGAFRNNIPFTSVVAFLQVADKGITQQTDDRGLHIFYAGDCKDYQTAISLKAEIAAKGIADAFVVALRDGKRVAITDDMK